jgi:S1-C subfamily serine protease
MRAAVLCLLLIGCGSAPVVTTGRANLAVSTALRHTLLMTEGCTAVDIGRGRVLTAKHCVDSPELADEYSVGAVVYRSPERDFAVLYDAERFRHSRARLRVPVLGEHVYAVGFPSQLDKSGQKLTVTDGIIAGPCDAEGSLRFTAPIYYGNSGGGVWADDGSLIGISVSGFLTMPGQSYLVSMADILEVLP